MEAPLSSAQYGIWIAQALTRDPLLYCEAIVVGLRDPQSIATVRRAVESVLYANLSLLGRVHRGRAGSIPNFEDGCCPPDIVNLEQSELPEVRRILEVSPIDAAIGPLARVYLVSATGRVTDLVIAVHHIACDGLGLHTVVEQLWEELSGRGTLIGQPAKLLFTDFLRRKARSLPDRKFVETVARHLVPLAGRQGGPPPASLNTYEGGHSGMRLLRGHHTLLETAAANAAVTIFTLYCAAFCEGISRTLQIRDFALSIGVTEQFDDPAFTKVVGHYINLIPVAIHVSNQGYDVASVQRLGATIAEAVDARRIHVSDILSTKMMRGADPNQLLRFVISYEEGFRNLVRPPIASVSRVDLGRAGVPVLLSVVEDPADVLCQLTFQKSHLSNSDAEQLLTSMDLTLKRLARPSGRNSTPQRTGKGTLPA